MPCSSPREHPLESSGMRLAWSRFGPAGVPAVRCPAGRTGDPTCRRQCRRWTPLCCAPGRWPAVVVPPASPVSDLFGLSVPPWELMVRGTLTYWFLFAVFRFVLRRDVGSVGIADVLLLVLIADASQNAMSGGYETVSDGAVLVGTIVGWNYLLDWATYRFTAVRRIVGPPALMLVRDGKALRRNLRQEFITLDELSPRSEAPMQLRSAGDSIRGSPSASRSESLSASEGATAPRRRGRHRRCQVGAHGARRPDQRGQEDTVRRRGRVGPHLCVGPCSAFLEPVIHREVPGVGEAAFAALPGRLQRRCVGHFRQPKQPAAGKPRARGRSYLPK